ncbi:hypothetical protein HPB50_015200 [Hyalomma asiaticum]|uniref:Uncharacterized protein n=1 Tax=Hyalomma asiaticum TaxID=266040 RepID=A0ACB7SNR3_HYAAI|nr:hypothetical protein HPB50_015200 [Hyalomma asiaticum]
MYLGCSVVLSVATGLCRTVEIYIMTFTPYDTTECCGVSRYVGFAIINFLMIGFKGVVMVRLFELYDDLSEAVESEASFAKLRRLMLYSNADYSRTPGRSKEATSYIMATKSGSLWRDP